MVFYIIWSWRNYWIIIHTGAVQRPVTFSDWITSIHNLRTAARVLDHTCYVINLKKSFDSICMKRYKVWFILVFENFGRLLSHVPIRFYRFDLSPRLMTIRAVLMIFRRRHLTLNEIFVQVFFIYKKKMWVSRAFTMRNLNSIFLNFSKSADVRRSIKKRAMTGILVQSRGC